MWELIIMIIKLRCKLNTILEAIKMVFIAYRKQSLLYTVYKYSADLDIRKNHTIRLSMDKSPGNGYEDTGKK